MRAFKALIAGCIAVVVVLLLVAFFSVITVILPFLLVIAFALLIGLIVYKDTKNKKEKGL